MCTLARSWRAFGDPCAARNGWWGFHKHPPREMTTEDVSEIHRFGGTILGAARGGLAPDELPHAVDFIRRNGVNMVFVIGGDGSHRGADLLYRTLAREAIPCAVVGIPKTIGTFRIARPLLAS